MTLIFMHIGRTAGTALRVALASAIPAYRRMFIYPEPPGDVSEAGFALLPEWRRGSQQLIFGHVEFGLHQHVPRPATYATWLRDPVQRVVSTWAFLASHYPQQIQGRSLEQWALRDRTPMSDNEMTRLIAGARRMPRRLSEADLDTALANLEGRFSVVGLTERAAKSTDLLANALGVRLPRLKRLNSTRLPDVPGRVRDDLREQNRLDVALYAYAVERFERSLRQPNSGRTS